MKRIALVVAVLCLLASNSAAQLEKGSIMAGVSSAVAMGGSWGSGLMSLGFNTTKYKIGSDPAEAEYKTTSYNLLPKGGYFVIDNLVAGLEVVITGYTEKDVEDDDKWGESLIGAGPYVRYYYPLDKIYPFAEAEFLFGSYKDSYTDDEYKAGVMMYGISLGAAVPLGSMVTVDILAGYYSASYNYKEEFEGETFKEICGGFGIKVGVSVYL